MNYWQIAAGSGGRDYAEEFIRYGMAFVGGEKQIATMEGVEIGDRIILKGGVSEIVAVGEVVQRDGKHRGQGDKEWLKDFDGWELEAYCYVDWHFPPKPISTSGLTRATIQNVRKKHLTDIADDVIVNVPLAPEPDPQPRDTSPVKDDEILTFLIKQGLRPGSAEDLTVALNRIRLLARYYYNSDDWKEIREHETRTFLIVPLLLALGWAEQQIKIELPVTGKTGKKRVDLACFSRPYRAEYEECVLLIESKGLSQGLDYAPEQAKGYAAHFPNCKVVVVSNGYSYKAFERTGDGDFPMSPTAYLNLLRPRDRYPIDPDNVDGALKALRLLLPSSLA